MEEYFLSARQLLSDLREGRATASELLEKAVERHKVLARSINAVVITDLENARRKAAEIDAALLRGENVGPLCGLPMTIKECLDIEAFPGTAANPSRLRKRIECDDSALVARLRAAGAVIWGKTNVSVNLSDNQSFNTIWGTTRNPYDIKRTPGGSSGGAAAALAAGITSLEVGSDIGGSLRNPAAFCGIVSLKPTWGVLPQQGHVPGGDGETEMQVLGPMARNVGDLRLLWRVLSNSTPDDSSSKRENWRLAVWDSQTGWPLSRDVRDALASVAGTLENSGSYVEVAKPDIDMEEMFASYHRLLCGVLSLGMPWPFKTVLNIIRKRYRGSRPKTADVLSLRRFAAHCTSSPRELSEARRQRDRMKSAVLPFFEKFDALLTPVSPTTAFPHAQNANIFARQYKVDGINFPYCSWLFWISLASILELPAAVVRVGEDKDGLPVGIQIVGPWNSEEKLLDIASMIEKQCGGFVPPNLSSFC